jgi:putative transposase
MTGGAGRAIKREGFTEADYARLLDGAHQQLGGSVVLVWDNLNTHVSRAISELVAARDWLTVFQLPPYASELNPVKASGRCSSGPWPTWPGATSPS